MDLAILCKSTCKKTRKMYLITIYNPQPVGCYCRHGTYRCFPSNHNKTFMLTFKSYQIKVMRNSLACIPLWIWFSPLNPLKRINTAHPRETNCDSPFAVQHYIYCQGLQPWPRALDLHWGPQEYEYLQARFLGFPEHALFLVSPAYRSFVRHL